MFEIMYLIFFAFVIVIAVAVSIYEIKARRNAENAFWRECEARKAEAEKLGDFDAINKENKILHEDVRVYRDQLKIQEEYRRKLVNANEALQKRNFDDMMSLFECTIGEGGKEYYEKDGICLIVENGKCIGYYRPHGTDVCEGEEESCVASDVNNSSSVTHCVTPSPAGEGSESYEAPSAEVVEGGEEP